MGIDAAQASPNFDQTYGTDLDVPRWFVKSTNVKPCLYLSSGIPTAMLRFEFHF